MWTRSELKEKAKFALKRSYWGCVLVCLIITIISGGGSGASSGYSNGNMQNSTNNSQALTNPALGGSGDINDIIGSLNESGMLTAFLVAFFGIMAAVLIVSLVLAIFVFNPLLVGCYRYVVEACFDKKTVGDMGVLGCAFKKGKYGKVVKTLFLESLYVFLWSLLLIIPGIIKAYEYRMIPFILAENPELETKQVFALSKEMMTGNKWAAFVLDLSFIGWYILSIFTCGILAIFYVIPYEQLTDAYLYDTLKKRASFDYFDHTLGAPAAPIYNTNADTYSSAESWQPMDQGSDNE